MVYKYRYVAPTVQGVNTIRLYIALLNIKNNCVILK